MESVKSVSDIYAPMCGQVVEVNRKLESNPETINISPYGDGWMFKLKMDDKRELDTLMDAKEYQKLLGEKI